MIQREGKHARRHRHDEPIAKSPHQSLPYRSVQPIGSERRRKEIQQQSPGTSEFVANKELDPAL